MKAIKFNKKYSAYRHVNRVNATLRPFAVTKAANLVCIFAPVFLYFHAQIEPYATSKQLLKIGTRLRANLFDGRTALANDDALLAFALHVNICENAIQILLAVVLELLALNANSVRHLVIK